MKIKSIYISAFGALKDFSLDFSDGFQVIYGENEAGKTTVAEFIKSVFYGTGRRAAGQSMSIREKYAPFDGTPAGGRIVFEHSGREYCIERQFRKSDATDKITLTDTASGKSDVCASDIGKELFGITVQAFERSVFIGNAPDFSFDEAAAGEINQKLSNAALTGEDGVSYGKVLGRLDDARLKLVSKSGKTGSLALDIARYNSLLEARGECDAAARKKQELNDGITKAQEKIDEIGKKHAEIQKLLDSAKDFENGQKLKEYLELKDKLDAVTKSLTLPDGTVADDMFLKKFDFGFSKLAAMEEKLKGEKEDLKILESAAAAREGNSPEQIREKLEAAKEELAKNEEKRLECESAVLSLKEETESLKSESESLKSRKKPVSIILLITGATGMLAGAALYFTLKNTALFAAVCAAGAILAALSFVFRPYDKSAAAKAREKLAAKQNELVAKQSELNMINGEKNNIEAKMENLNISLNFGVNEEKKIKDTGERINRDSEALQTEREKVRKFFGLSESTDLDEIKNQAESLRATAEEQKQIKLRLSYLSRDLGGISYDEARARLSESGESSADFDMEEAKAKAQKLAGERIEAENLKTRYETELKTGFRGMRDPEDLRREISELKEKIAVKQTYYDAVSAAYDELKESLIEARRSFGSVLENKTLENLREITGGAYGKVNVSNDFDISAEKNGTFGMHDAEFLSRGTKDQIYLSLRLAVARLITEKEPLPVILDDALSQYDDKRFLSAFEFLKDYGKDTEVCLFTCHDYVKDEAERQGVNVIKI